MVSVEQFLTVGNLFSEPALLLRKDGEILAANARMDQFGFDPERVCGRKLPEITANDPSFIADYLQRCARSREPVLGAIDIRKDDGETVACRCDGANVDTDTTFSDSTVLLIKFAPKALSLTQFRLLNRRIDELTEEIRRRQQAEQQLRDHRESLQVTLSSIGDGVIVTDGKAKVTFLNQVAQNLTGWSQEEAEGQDLETVFRIINEETREKVENPVAKVLRVGQIVGLANHTILIAKDGSERAIDDSASPIRHRGGPIVGVVLVFRDVSIKRRLEIDKNRLAAIVESSQDAIIGQSLDGRVTDWNAGAERLFGFAAEEVIGRPLAESIVPADRVNEYRSVLDRQGRSHRVELYETIRKAKDGRIIPVSIHMSPIHDDDGRLIGVSAIDRDISQQKQTETMLRFLADASESLNSLVDYRITLQRVAELAVPGFADWCAVDLIQPDGSLERLAISHVDPRKVELVHEAFRRHLPNPAVDRGAFRVVRTGRPDYLAEISDAVLRSFAVDAEHLAVLEELGLRSYLCVPLKSKDGIFGTLTFVSAESGRRYGPEEAAVAEDLANRALVAIENARLYQEIKEADRRKDEFLAMLAHELRNPLAPIRTGLDLLSLRMENEDEVLRLMRQQVEHLVRLVDDLLDVSRIMRGKVELRPESVQLSTILRQALDIVSESVNNKRQTITLNQPSERAAWLQADPVRMVQVIENLLSNASKYTEVGGHVEITVRLHASRVEIVVADNGIGIEPDLLPKVFDLFTQASRTLDRAQGGLGIGLTLVRNLVEMHGGTVCAESDGPGTGSRFTVTLPLAAAGSAGDDGQSQPTQTKRSDSRKVLIVDDNADAAKTLAILIKQLGDHRVEIAHDGRATLEMAPVFGPDLVLLDIGLPEMDGFEIARKLRDQPSFDGTKVVALTGYGQEEDRRRSKEAGFDDHLVKPVSVDTLRQLLQLTGRRR